MMGTKIFKKKKNEDETVEYWLSYSDLMASLTIIFILIFVHIILLYNENLESKEKRIQALTDVKRTIILRLFEEFGDEIQIDAKTGAIKLRSDILFDVNKSEIKPDGKTYLRKFIPRYLKILFGDPEIKNSLSRIIVEGHTDDDGTYLFNLELSQARALSVVKYIYTEEVPYPAKEELEVFIAAIGRSKTDLIKDQNNMVNKEKSRRVEFKFELKDEDIINAILEEVRANRNE